MPELVNFFVGRYVRAAKTLRFSRLLSTSLRFSRFEVEDLKVVLEEIKGSVVDIAKSLYGPWFLFNLFRRCEGSGLEKEIEALLSDLLIDDVISHEIGLRCLLNLLPVCPRKRIFVLHEVVSKVCSFLSSYGDIKPLFDQLFTLYSHQDMEVVFCEIKSHFLELSLHPVAFNNLLTLVDTFGVDLARAFKEEDLWCLLPNEKACFLFRKFITNPHENGGAIIFTKLLGHYQFLSQESYSNFFVQTCFESGDFAWCQLIAEELDGHMMKLATHCYGNYVVQKMIRRYKSQVCDLPPSLLSILNSGVLNGHKCGKEVWFTYNKIQNVKQLGVSPAT